MQIKLLTIILSSILLLHTSCSEETKKSTKTKLYSDDFNTAKERVEVLKKHITAHSDFKDAEFEIFNVNGEFTNERLIIPGPSSWNYKFVIWIDAKDINKWTNGFTKINEEVIQDSVPWIKEFNKKMEHKISTKDVGELYKREGENNYLWLFKKSNLIFRSIVNL